MTSSQKSEEVSGGTGASGVPGTASNLPRPTSRPGSTLAGVSRRTESIAYQTTRTVRRTRVAGINMPNMDGLQFLGELRSHAPWKHIPVVMIGTEESHAKVMEAVQLGAKGFLRKPFTADQIKEKLAGIL